MTGPSGRGALEITAAPGRGGPVRSVVSRAFASSPLRLLTPRNHGPAAWVYTGSYGGGLVDGDALDLSVAVGPGASAFLSTQASTKVYRSPRGTEVRLAATVGPAGLLVLWPDAVVPFAGSRYTQRQHVALAAGASLLVVDMMSSGRRGSGERWDFARYESRITIARDDRVVLQDALLLTGDDGSLRRRMGRFDVFCTCVLTGPALAPAAAHILNVVGEMPVEQQADLPIAASPLKDGGAIVRIAGRSVEQVERVLRDNVADVPRLLGDNPWARKW